MNAYGGTPEELQLRCRPSPNLKVLNCAPSLIDLEAYGNDEDDIL